ncbi:MAG: pyrroline-5-carboxylate reductase [Verrucomicrobia bacterium]|nr:pyrroline-5-carboxylate reductase [Verrucomicrobiota bacterium]
MRIRLIGHGKMGKALVTALSRLEHQVVIHDRQVPAIEGEEVVILAVKPTSLEGLPGGMEKSLVVSVMTGIPLKTLQQISGSKRVIRAMPNLPVSVGQGVVGWIGSGEAEEVDLDFARKLFGAMGLALELDNEGLIDAITALSGSGPAYYFYLTELLADKGVQMGFSQEQAQALARQTLMGAAALLQASDKSAAYWRKQVTSKGGTTAAAFTAFQSLPPLFFEAIDRAYKRAEELGAS